MIRKKSKISISKLLILSNCLIMAAFFSVSFYFSQNSYQDIMEKELRDKQNQMLVYISDTLNERMKSAELLARSAVNNYNIINNLLNYKENKNSYEQLVFQNNMNQTLSSLAYSMSDIISVNILMDEPNLKTTKTNGVYYYENYTGDAQTIRNMSNGWIPTRKNDLSIETYLPYLDTYVMRIYAGLYSGESIGHLVININENLFYEQLKEYYTNGNSEILFIDENGTIISSTDRTLLGQNVQETPYGKYREILDGEREEDREARNMIFSKRNLEGRKCYVMAVADYAEIVAPFRETQRNVLLYSLALFLVFASFSAHLAYKISKPILQLSREVANFKGDGWTYRPKADSRIYEISVLCNGFAQMTVQIDQLIKSLLKQEKEKQKKELEVLQAQINPHFLYNTLEAINWMALSMKQKEISSMVISLGKFLRLSLNKGKGFYRVKDELSHLTCYLDIQNIRCRGKILFSLDAEDGVLECLMIKLLLQPLVENSILHGFDSRGGAGRIWVKVFEEEPYLYLTVSDDGCGMSQELVKDLYDMKTETGHGIKNVMRRIKLYYGEGCGITIQSTPEVGTTIELKILKEIPSQQI